MWPLTLVLPNTFILFGFPIFRFWAYPMKVILSVSDEGYSDRAWWRLFWAYLMKVILSVPDEGYSERVWWRLFWAYLMKVILSVPDEGYSERTWWRLFWACLVKVILSVRDEGYSERTWWRLFWAYLMKVILSVPDEGYSERTWWRLFQKRVVCTKLDIYQNQNSNIRYIRDNYVFHCIITIISWYNISNMAAHCDNVTAIWFIHNVHTI